MGEESVFTPQVMLNLAFTVGTVAYLPVLPVIPLVYIVTVKAIPRPFLRILFIVVLEFQFAVNPGQINQPFLSGRVSVQGLGSKPGQPLPDLMASPDSWLAGGQTEAIVIGIGGKAAVSRDFVGADDRHNISPRNI
jgi:hypothetical protein